VSLPASVDRREQERDRLLALRRIGCWTVVQGWIDVSGEIDVVEADDAHVTGYGHARSCSIRIGPDGHRVAHRQDRREPQAGREGPPTRGHPAVDAGRSDETRSSGIATPIRRERGAIAGQSAGP
jgi:hypothetical protein